MTLKIALVCLDDTFNTYTFDILVNIIVNIPLVYHLAEHENTLNIFSIPLRYLQYISSISFDIPFEILLIPCHTPLVYYLISHEYTFVFSQHTFNEPFYWLKKVCDRHMTGILHLYSGYIKWYIKVYAGILQI